MCRYVGEYAGGPFPSGRSRPSERPAGPPSTCTTTAALFADEGRFGLRGAISGALFSLRGDCTRGEAGPGNTIEGGAGAAAPSGKDARKRRFSLTGEERGEGAGFADAKAAPGTGDKVALCMLPPAECGLELRGVDCVLPSSIPGPTLCPPVDHELGGRVWLTDRSSKGRVEAAALDEVERLWRVWPVLGGV
jgi:hypothetical protein